ncbi:MAG: DUF4292 domain-containing protein [Arachidicoccus sp.]|nr:DUF4292 domain-containing protein [Arachidicoccus sp.]
MKKIVLFTTIFVSLTYFSCKPVKKAEKVQKQIARKDTSKIVIVSDSSQSAELDTLHQTLKDLDSNDIKGFQTFSGKAKLDYNDNENSQSATANIHIKEDSVIWISITAILGIEAVRVKITPDSLIIMNKLKHTVSRRSINFIQEFLKVPLGFNDLQDIILGNSIFMQGDITSYKHTRNQWFVTIAGKELTNFVTVTDKNKKFYIRHLRLQDSTGINNRICDMTFNTHQLINNYWFSQNRIIEVSDSVTKLQIKLQFKNFDFGLPVTFSFNIPDSYEEK